MLTLLRTKQCICELPVGQGAGAALADEVEAEDRGPQPQPFGNISAQTGAQITRARRNDHGIDRLRLQVRAAQCGGAGRRGEPRCMGGESPVQRVGVDAEHVGERVDREPARLDAIVARQHRLRHRVRARVQAAEPVRRGECIPAVAFRITSLGQRRADGIHIHSASPSHEAIRTGLQGHDSARQAVKHARTARAPQRRRGSGEKIRVGRARWQVHPRRLCHGAVCPPRSRPPPRAGRQLRP